MIHGLKPFQLSSNILEWLNGLNLKKVIILIWRDGVLFRMSIISQTWSHEKKEKNMKRRKRRGRGRSRSRKRYLTKLVPVRLVGSNTLHSPWYSTWNAQTPYGFRAECSESVRNPYGIFFCSPFL